MLDVVSGGLCEGRYSESEIYNNVERDRFDDDDDDWQYKMVKFSRQVTNEMLDDLLAALEGNTATDEHVFIGNVFFRAGTHMHSGGDIYHFHGGTHTHTHHSGQKTPVHDDDAPVDGGEKVAERE